MGFLKQEKNLLQQPGTCLNSTQCQVTLQKVTKMPKKIYYIRLGYNLWENLLKQPGTYIFELHQMFGSFCSKNLNNSPVESWYHLLSYSGTVGEADRTRIRQEWIPGFDRRYYIDFQSKNFQKEIANLTTFVRNMYVPGCFSRFFFNLTTFSTSSPVNSNDTRLLQQFFYLQNKKSIILGLIKCVPGYFSRFYFSI